MDSDPLDFSLSETDQAQEKSERNLGFWFRITLGALIAAAFLTFIFQNTDSVDVNFLGWSISLGQSILMVLCGVAGVIVWEVAGFISRRMRS